MYTLNKVYKLRILTVLILFCGIINSGFSQQSLTYDISLLGSTLLEKLPTENRNPDNQQDIEDLYDDLQIAEIYNIGDLNNLIDTYLKEVLILEKDICTQMLESEEPDLTATVSTGTYSAEFEDVELIKEGIYFTTVGLIRTMIDLRHQETDDTEQEYELE